MAKIAPRTVCPRYFKSTTSLRIWPCSPPCAEGRPPTASFAAVAGLTITALSHVSFVIGLGSSCSQPLFAKRPSRMHGSGRNEMSSEPPAA